MNSFVVEIWDDEADRCTFYTVRWDESEESETEKFFTKYYEDESYKEVARELYNLVISTIGDEFGAIDRFFNRYENEVNALPPKGKIAFTNATITNKRFPLRLYLLRITEHIVVIFNGGVKNAETIQECEGDLEMKWREACMFAKKITEAIQDGTVEVDEEGWLLLSYNKESEIILP